MTAASLQSQPQQLSDGPPPSTPSGRRGAAPDEPLDLSASTRLVSTRLNPTRPCDSSRRRRIESVRVVAASAVRVHSPPAAQRPLLSRRRRRHNPIRAQPCRSSHLSLRSPFAMRRTLSFPLLAAAAALALVALLAAGTASAQYVVNPALMPHMQMVQMDEQQPFTVMAAGQLQPHAGSDRGQSR